MARGKKIDRTRQAADDNIKRRMRIACRITKATNTHSEYVILVAFPLQIMASRTRLAVTLYIHCLSCVKWIWRMRIACRITKATNTHSEYVILVAFPLQIMASRTRLAVTLYITLPVLCEVDLVTVNLLIAVLLKRSFAMLVKSDESVCRNTDVSPSYRH